jgi:hypothetical protein
MGFSNLVSKKASVLHNLQTGFIYHYAFLMLMGVTFLVGLLQLWYTFFTVLDFRLVCVFVITTFFAPNIALAK